MKERQDTAGCLLQGIIELDSLLLRWASVCKAVLGCMISKYFEWCQSHRLLYKNICMVDAYAGDLSERTLSRRMFWTLMVYDNVSYRFAPLRPVKQLGKLLWKSQVLKWHIRSANPMLNAAVTIHPAKGDLARKQRSPGSPQNHADTCGVSQFGLK